MRRLVVILLVLAACSSPTATTAARVCDTEMRAIYSEKQAAGVFADNSQLPYLMEQNPWVFSNESIFFSATNGSCVVERRPH